jgi:hypothetical protein
MKLISLSEVSKLLKCDKSNLRKKIIKRKIKTYKYFDENLKQVCLAIDNNDIDKIYNREVDTGKQPEPLFYLIQLCPEISENRVKMGFTNNLEQRKKNYATICPTISVVKTWKCNPQWESAVISQAITKDCKKVGQEVFDVPSLKDITNRLDNIFAAFDE